MKRLFWDIETSPNVVLAWRAGYKLDISHDSIVKERAIITIAWKWEGEKQVHALHWNNDQSDKSMLLAFVKVANEADELVAHYGDRFDLPWIKTRCLFHGINAFPIYKTIDTKAWASKYFYFNSNRLDYIAKFLGFEGKIKTDYQLWLDIVLKKCPKALARMIEYNKKDVIELEKVWGKMQLAVSHHTHSGALSGGEKWSCPRCESKSVKTSKTKVTAKGAKQYQMQCSKCGGYYSISERVHADYLKR